MDKTNTTREVEETMGGLPNGVMSASWLHNKSNNSRLKKGDVFFLMAFFFFTRRLAKSDQI